MSKSECPDTYLKEMQELLSMVTTLLASNRSVSDFISKAIDSGTVSIDVYNRLIRPVMSSAIFQTIPAYIDCSDTIERKDISLAYVCRTGVIALLINRDIPIPIMCKLLNRLCPRSMSEDDLFKVACVARFRLLGIRQHIHLHSNGAVKDKWFYPSNLNPMEFYNDF